MNAGNPNILVLAGPLNLLLDHSQKSLFSRVKAYNLLADTLASNEDKLGLKGALSASAHVYVFWNHFLRTIPENQMAKPENYSFTKFTAANPFWVSLLYVALDVKAPITDKSLDETLSMGNDHKAVCGFIYCCLPIMGIYEPIITYSSCVAVLMCCFRNCTVRPIILAHLLEIVTKQLLPNKQITYQM